MDKKVVTPNLSYQHEFFPGCRIPQVLGFNAAGERVWDIDYTPGRFNLNANIYEDRDDAYRDNDFDGIDYFDPDEGMMVRQYVFA